MRPLCDLRLVKLSCCLEICVLPLLVLFQDRFTLHLEVLLVGLPAKIEGHLGCEWHAGVVE